MKLDQLTVAIDLALLGVGLILTGALVPWHGWLAHTFGILLIVIGAILCLVDGLRLLGWRSLLWPRSLVLDAQGISDDTKKGATINEVSERVHQCSKATGTIPPR